jgi:hypothetical protein
MCKIWGQRWIISSKENNDNWQLELPYNLESNIYVIEMESTHCKL